MKNYKSFAMIISFILVASLTSCVKDKDIPTTSKKNSTGAKYGEVQTVYEVRPDVNFPNALVKYTYTGTDGRTVTSTTRNGLKVTAHLPVVQGAATFWLKYESLDISEKGEALKLSMLILVTDYDEARANPLKWDSQYGGKATPEGTECGNQEREVSGKFYR